MRVVIYAEVVRDDGKAIAGHVQDAVLGRIIGDLEDLEMLDGGARLSVGNVVAAAPTAREWPVSVSKSGTMRNCQYHPIG